MDRHQEMEQSIDGYNNQSAGELILTAETVVSRKNYGNSVPSNYFYIDSRTNQMIQILPHRLEPQLTYCKSCSKEVLTKVEKTKGKGDWVACSLLCCIGCWVVFWVPFCTERFRDAVHYCSECNMLINKVNFVNDC